MALYRCGSNSTSKPKIVYISGYLGTHSPGANPTYFTDVPFTVGEEPISSVLVIYTIPTGHADSTVYTTITKVSDTPISPANTISFNEIKSILNDERETKFSNSEVLKAMSLRES